MTPGGASSGAGLALEAAARNPAISKLAVWEPPYHVDDSAPRLPDDFAGRLAALVEDGRRADAAELFMVEAAGVPAEALAGTRDSGRSLHYETGRGLFLDDRADQRTLAGLEYVSVPERDPEALQTRSHQRPGPCAASELQPVRQVTLGDDNAAFLRLLVAQGDRVRLGDGAGLDRSESFAEALASLPQELERVGGGIAGNCAIRVSPMLLDEVSLEGCGDFVGRLQRVVDGSVPCSVVNHVASIPRRSLLPADQAPLP
jgi:hypothetical protein